MKKLYYFIPALFFSCKKQWVSIPIKRNSSEFSTYTINLSDFSEVKNRIMQITLQPLSDVAFGNWKIEGVIIK